MRLFVVIVQRNAVFTELLLGCRSSRHKSLSTYQVSSPAVVFFVSYMYMLIHAPFIMYCLRLTESDDQDFLKYTIMLATPGPSLYTQYYHTV